MSMGWRWIADAARFDEFNPADMTSEGLRITGMELLSVIICYVDVSVSSSSNTYDTYREGVRRVWYTPTHHHRRRHHQHHVVGGGCDDEYYYYYYHS
jgi:hypothetical protein